MAKKTKDFADPLNELTSEAHRIASKARRCFLEGHPTIAYEQIAELHSFLDKCNVGVFEVKSWARLRQKGNLSIEKPPTKPGEKPIGHEMVWGIPEKDMPPQELKNHFAPNDEGMRE